MEGVVGISREEKEKEVKASVHAAAVDESGGTGFLDGRQGKRERGSPRVWRMTAEVGSAAESLGHNAQELMGGNVTPAESLKSN